MVKMPDLHPSGFVPQRQPFAGLRMKVLAQAQEFRTARGAGQTQLLRSLPIPLPEDLLTFRVIIADAQVFLKILSGVAQTVLRFGCKHTPTVRQPGAPALKDSGRIT